MKAHFVTGLMTLVSVLVASPLSADTGKDLYEKSCTKCHSTEVFTGDGRSVKSFEGLKKRVKQCSLAAGSDWVDDEIKVVVDYLNKNFYKF